jgi:hypothetical protein
MPKQSIRVYAVEQVEAIISGYFIFSIIGQHMELI